jgi:hypothetical protein
MPSSHSGIGAKAKYYVILGGFFSLWSYKSEIRDKYLPRAGYLAVSVPPILLILNMLAEFYEHSWLPKYVSPLLHNPRFSRWLVAVALGAVAYLLWHHWNEVWKPKYESTFVLRLYELLEGRRFRSASAEPIKGALQLFHSVFDRAGIKHVALHLPESGVLKIRQDHVFPYESDPRFFVELILGQGVAGAVYGDSKPRYVPRIHLPFRKIRPWIPTLYFPHGVRFDFERVDGPEGVLSRGELGDDDIDPKIVALSDPDRPPFHSFLSVPVRRMTGHDCIGVLSFDFDRTDPLDKVDIAMACVFGLLLAEEIAGGGLA